MNRIMRYNAGFTLIELMIGILLTSMFVGGMAQVFMRTSQNFRTQRTLSYMMEDARFALDKLNSEFRRIGFLTNREMANGSRNTIYHGNIVLDYTGGVYTIRNDGVVTASNVLTMGAGEAIRGATNLAGLASDSVIIRYQLSDGNEFADNQYSPCTRGFAMGVGENITDRYVITIVFYMEPNVVAGSNVLFCRAFRENLKVGGATQLLAAVPLISNVEKLRVLYGQTDTVMPAPANGTVYRNVIQVNAALGWAAVRSARISLALRSEEINISVANPGNYTINGKLFVAPTSAAQRRLYRVFSTTAAFRNELL